MQDQLNKLLERKKSIDEKIARLKNTEREARKARAIKALETSGLLELPEGELLEKLAAVKAPKSGASS